MVNTMDGTTSEQLQLGNLVLFYDLQFIDELKPTYQLVHIGLYIYTSRFFIYMYMYRYIYSVIQAKFSVKLIKVLKGKCS